MEAHLLTLEYLEKGGESGAFNLGSGDGYSVKEIIDTARRITGKEIPAVVEPAGPATLRADCLQQEGCQSPGAGRPSGAWRRSSPTRGRPVTLLTLSGRYRHPGGASLPKGRGASSWLYRTAWETPPTLFWAMAYGR